MTIKNKETKDYLELIEIDRGYTLLVSKDDRKSESSQAIFRVDNFLTGGFYFVTSREFQEYAEKFNTLPLDHRNQYLEVGAGLGGFTEHLINSIEGLERSPIIVDPVDYRVLQEMLNEGLNRAKISGLSKPILSRLERLLKRAQLYGDSEHVENISLTFNEAMRAFPNLLENVDYIIDNCASSYYPEI